jgi:hypothetical protein
VYSTGVFLVWTGNNFILDGFGGDMYFDGKLVDWDENEQPYIGEDGI